MSILTYCVHLLILMLQISLKPIVLLYYLIRKLLVNIRGRTFIWYCIEFSLNYRGYNQPFCLAILAASIRFVAFSLAIPSDK